ncbi:MAG: hypothetical protein VKJ02_08340 [Snowella sp.]|nr:hypothetical protein [Snowella sp.]
MKLPIAIFKNYNFDPFINSSKIILRPDDNGTFVAHIPAIARCHAWGERTDRLFV